MISFSNVCVGSHKGETEQRWVHASTCARVSASAFKVVSEEIKPVQSKNIINCLSCLTCFSLAIF